MRNLEHIFDVVTITLNPAIDRTLSIPGFAAGTVNRVEAVTDAPGGKGVNVAVALADYGLRVAATGFLGAENSASFRTLFVAKKITDEFVQVPGRTRMGIKIVDSIGGETTDINFPGLAPTRGDLAAFHTRLERLSAKWVVLAGSLPPGVDTGFYRELIGTFKASGTRVALDTSGEALETAVGAAPHVVKPNIHELGALVGRSLGTHQEIVVAARQLVAQGVELVAVSMGAKGACFVTADEALLALPPTVDVSSTVGAGDAMVAGMIAAQLRGHGLRECARMATSFSVYAIAKREPEAKFDASAMHALVQSVTTRSVGHALPL